MTSSREFDDYEDPAIWDGAVAVGPEDTRDLKIHLTLRLGADLFRKVIQHRKKRGIQTTTAAIEDLLKRALGTNNDALLQPLAREFKELRQTITAKAPRTKRRA